MQKQTKTTSYPPAMKIENFEAMQARYQMLPLAGRALAVITDAKPALTIAQRILTDLSKQPKLKQALANLRNNSILIARIRASEAKSSLMDESVDFIHTAEQKLDIWNKTLNTIANGNTKATLEKNNSNEKHIVNASGYLSLIKLVVIELASLDKNNQPAYDTMLSEIRRCTTILSDFECASELNNVVLH